jgi:hypothetical protein
MPWSSEEKDLLIRLRKEEERDKVIFGPVSGSEHRLHSSILEHDPQE